jgi:hypothetical protein
MATTPRKTFPELQALSAPLVDSDVLAVYRSPGPAKRTTASVVRDYIAASGNTYSLLDALSPANRAIVLAGGDPGNIGATLNTLLLAARDGSTIDASMLSGTITLESNPFSGLVDAPVTLVTGPCLLQMNFNTLDSLSLPHRMEWRMEGTTVKPSVNLTTWPGAYTQGFGLISTKFRSDTASGTAAATTLTVADGTLFRVGSQIAINGILSFPTITTAIVEALTASTPSTITFTTSQASTIADSTVYLMVDSEIIFVTVAANGLTATVTTRGALGTTAASHLASASAVLMAADVFEVTSIAGNVLTLDHALPRSFTGATWWSGTVGSRISGWGTIDGAWDRVFAISKSWSGVLSTLSNNFDFSGDFEIDRCNFAGVFTQGTKGRRVSITKIARTGDGATNIGASLWSFSNDQQGFADIDIIDDGNLGVVLDCKSSNVTAIGLVKGVIESTVRVGVLMGHNVPVEISAGLSNAVIIEADESLSGPYLNTSSTQYTTPVNPVGNYINLGHAKNTATYVSATRVANAAQNTVIINGQSRRVIEGTITFAAPYGVTADSTDYINFTIAGVQPGDRCSVTPGQDMPIQTVVFAVTPSIADAFRLGFANSRAFAALIDAGDDFFVRAEGPWSTGP